MQEKKFIEEIVTDKASSVLLVKKPNGKYRTCVDYRSLNEATEADSYPMPLIDDILGDIGRQNYFSTLDPKEAYYNVQVSQESKKYMAFTCEKGTYQFNVMPFGLKNAPSIFQRMMDDILAPLKMKNVHVNLDDVIIVSKDLNTHEQDVSKVIH
jgi:Reverse transcriptase (RNA-dependent DNA polymerase)